MTEPTKEQIESAKWITRHYLGDNIPSDEHMDLELISFLAQREAKIRAEATEPYIAALMDAGKALKFCAQWGGRSGRIPGNGPGTKTHTAKEAFERLKLFLFKAAAGQIAGSEEKTG